MMINKKGIGLRPLVMSIVMVVLFVFFILAFVSNVLQEKNPSSEVLDSKYGLNESMDKMQEITEDFSNTSNSIYARMGKANPTAVDYIFLMFQGAFYIPKAFLTFIFTGISAVSSILFKGLAGTGMGDSLAIILSVLISSITVAIVLLIVKSIRTGETER